MEGEPGSGPPQLPNGDVPVVDIKDRHHRFMQRHNGKPTPPKTSCVSPTGEHNYLLNDTMLPEEPDDTTRMYIVVCQACGDLLEKIRTGPME